MVTKIPTMVSLGWRKNNIECSLDTQPGGHDTKLDNSLIDDINRCRHKVGLIPIGWDCTVDKVDRTSAYMYMYMTKEKWRHFNWKTILH